MNSEKAMMNSSRLDAIDEELDRLTSIEDREEEAFEERMGPLRARIVSLRKERNELSGLNLIGYHMVIREDGTVAN